MQPYFSLDLPFLSWVLMGAALTLAIAYVAWLWCRARTLSRFVDETEQQRDYTDELPPVSIIVDAMNETHQLTQILPLLLHQEYPEMEVIVVVDSSAEATSDMLSEMKEHFTNLHITFAPYGSRSLSRKKLALMIGIKAARHDIILTTSANCRPTNEQWLRLMMRNFTPDTDIVLGYSHYRYKHDRHLGHTMRTFDTVTTGMQWIVPAINGKPFRGTSDNMAYRKHLFFDVRGFSATMDLNFGEDDLFLSEISRTGNTRLELAPESQMAVYYEDLPRAHALLKMRRDFTARRVATWPFVAQAAMSWCCWLRLGCLAAAIALAPLNTLTWALAAAVMLITWIPAVMAMVRNCRILQAPPLRLTVPVLTLWRPIYNAIYRLRGMRHRASNYTDFYK